MKRGGRGSAMMSIERRRQEQRIEKCERERNDARRDRQEENKAMRDMVRI